MNIAYIDVQKQPELTEAQVKFFNDNGFLVLRNSLSKEVRILSIFLINTRQCKTLSKSYFNFWGVCQINEYFIQELESLREETKSMIDNIGHGPDYWFNDEIPENWYKLHSHGTKDPSTKPEGETKRGRTALYATHHRHWCSTHCRCSVPNWVPCGQGHCVQETHRALVHFEDYWGLSRTQFHSHVGQFCI